MVTYKYEPNSGKYNAKIKETFYCSVFSGVASFVLPRGCKLSYLVDVQLVLKKHRSSVWEMSDCLDLEELKQPWHNVIVPLAGSIGHAESLYNGLQCITMHHDGIWRMLTLLYNGSTSGTRSPRASSGINPNFQTLALVTLAGCIGAV